MKEGWLGKQGEDLANIWRKRYCLLLSEPKGLVYFKTNVFNPDDHSMVVKARGFIAFEEVTDVELPTNSTTKFTVCTGPRKWNFECSSASDRDDWEKTITSLRDTIKTSDLVLNMPSEQGSSIPSPKSQAIDEGSSSSSSDENATSSEDEFAKKKTFSLYKNYPNNQVSTPKPSGPPSSTTSSPKSFSLSMRDHDRSVSSVRQTSKQKLVPTNTGDNSNSTGGNNNNTGPHNINNNKQQNQNPTVDLDDVELTIRPPPQLLKAPQPKSKKKGNKPSTYKPLSNFLSRNTDQQ